MDNLNERIIQGLKTEDRKDIEFRSLILLSQISDIIKYITHDQRLNPNARPYGCSEDEKLIYGQLLSQLAIVMHLRNIDFYDSFELGLRHWEAKDWKKSVNKLGGQCASQGAAEGRACVINESKDIENIQNGDIVILPEPSLLPINIMRKINGIVTDNGGMLCHSAIIAREFKVPCIVGTGNASKIISNGEKISINAEKGEIKVNRG